MKALRRGCLVGLLLVGLMSCSRPGASIGGTLVLPGSLGGASEEGAALGDMVTFASPAKAAGPKEAEVIPGEVLVFFEDEGLSLKALAPPQPLRTLRRFAPELGDLRLLRAAGLSADETKVLARTLASRPGVRAAFPNWRVYALVTPNDEYYPLQWHYAAMNLENAWTIETGQAPGVTVAIVDSGIVAHPDLVGHLLPGYDFISDPSVAGDGDARDADPTDLGGQSGYHGSHVAGTVAASTNNGTGVAGVSWGARLVPARALGVTGGGAVSDMLDAITWAAGQSVPGVPNNPNPASVINMSLGANINEPCPAEFGAIFRALGAAGKIVVAAAGNDNLDTATFFPASCDGVVTVGATGPTGTRAPYSNYGPAVDIMAPGGDVSQTLTVGTASFPAGVLSTVFDDATRSFSYAFYQGTSMASPHVAGLVALMKARNPGLTFDQVLAQLRGASSSLSAADCQRPAGTDCGAGSVDAAAALGSSAAPPPTPPTGTLPILAAAFYCADAQCTGFNQELSEGVIVNPSADTAAYTIPNLSPGTYRAAAWQDLNDNGAVDAGDPFGYYPNFISLAAGQQLGNVTISLEAFTPQGNSRSGLEQVLEEVANRR